MQPERRKHVRILTIPNFGRALLVLLLLIATANVISELRPEHRGEYGRLTLRAEPVVVKHPEVVTEGEVLEGSATMPTTSLLGVAPAPPPAPVSTPLPQKDAGEGARATLSQLGDHVTIVGGPDGVHVETTRHDASPKLSGGIFRIEN